MLYPKAMKQIFADRRTQSLISMIATPFSTFSQKGLDPIRRLRGFKWTVHHFLDNIYPLYWREQKALGQERLRETEICLSLLRTMTGIDH